MPKVKCCMCNKLVYPVINVPDYEQPNDHAWVECPQCGWSTGNCSSETEALRIFTEKNDE